MSHGRFAGKVWSKVVLAVVCLAGATLAMVWLVGRRTRNWVAAIAVPVLLIAAPVLVFSVLFGTLATTGKGGPT